MPYSRWYEWDLLVFCKQTLFEMAAFGTLRMMNVHACLASTMSDFFFVYYVGIRNKINVKLPNWVNFADGTCNPFFSI